MTTSAGYPPVTPIALGCPDCQAPLTGADVCESCGLPLVGPTAVQLWQVDQQLTGLASQRERLLGERVRLLALLRSGEEPAGWQAGPATEAAGPPPVWGSVTQRPEASPRSVQNTLLGLGGLLLAGAGLVFAAVTYDRLGVVGRAMVLLVLTGLAAAAPYQLLKKKLSASAETLALVALVLTVVDAWSLRRAGFADTVDARSYTAVATGLLALLAGGYASVVRVKAAWLGSAALAQLPVVFVLARAEASLPVVAVTLAALAAVDGLVAAERKVVLPVRVVTALSAGLALLGALGFSLGAIQDGDRGGALGLLAIAAVLAGASARIEDRLGRALTSGLTVPLVGGAAFALAELDLTEPQRPLVLVAVALLGLQVAGLLPRPRREGPVIGALAVIAMALLLEAEALALAVAGPLAWLVEPWSGTGNDARNLVFPDQRWTGTVVTLVVLAGAAACAVGAGLVLDRVRQALAPAGALLVLTAVVLPLGLATSFSTALVLLLLIGAALAGGGVALLGRSRALGLALLTTGGVIALLAASWSTAQQDRTLVVLPVVAALAAALAVLLTRAPAGEDTGFFGVTSLVTAAGIATGAAMLLAGAELAAAGAAGDLATDQVGGLLLAAPAVAVALSLLLRGSHRIALEWSAATLALVAVLLTVEDAGWLSWALAASGLLVGVVAVRADRRRLAYVSGLLLSASSWVRLADAEVTAPEPYVLPLAAVALVLGHLRRRQHPETSSFSAYASGLSLALVPSLLASFGDDTPLRGVLLLPAAALVVVAGVQERLRAPLLIGGVVLAVDALQLLAPYAEALPRWTLLALVGGTLVALGATYEKRLQDVARLRERYDALT